MKLRPRAVKKNKGLSAKNPATDHYCRVLPLCSLKYFNIILSYLEYYVLATKNRI